MEINELFRNTKTSNMKPIYAKIIFSLAFFFCLSHLSTAQNLHYQVQIIDSCSGSYNGNYCISSICGIIGGSTFCAHTDCTIRNISTPYQVYYTCYDWPDCQSTGNYYITVTACRQSNCLGCKGTNTASNFICSDLQDGTALVTVVIK
jgi:hypothetical protein